MIFTYLRLGRGLFAVFEVLVGWVILTKTFKHGLAIPVAAGFAIFHGVGYFCLQLWQKPLAVISFVVLLGLLLWWRPELFFWGRQIFYYFYR